MIANHVLRWVVSGSRDSKTIRHGGLEPHPISIWIWMIQTHPTGETNLFGTSLYPRISPRSRFVTFPSVLDVRGKDKSLDLPVASFNYKFSYSDYYYYHLLFSHSTWSCLPQSHWYYLSRCFSFLNIFRDLGFFGHVSLLVLGWINKNVSWYLEDYLLVGFLLGWPLHASVASFQVCTAAISSLMIRIR